MGGQGTRKELFPPLEQSTRIEPPPSRSCKLGDQATRIELRRYSQQF